MLDAYQNPTLEAAIRMEVVEKKCGCCVRGTEVIRGAYVCKGNKKWPFCKREKNGFEYDEGES